MSFSANVKAELCREGLAKSCCAKAEAYGVLLYANTFSHREIKIITASPDFARRLPKLFDKAFGLGFDVLPEAGRKGKAIFLMIPGFDEQWNVRDFGRIGVIG